MPPKRKTPDGITSSTNSSVSSSSSPNEANKKKSRSNQTLKDKILDIVAIADDLVSLPSLKKKLIKDYDVPESIQFNSNVNKTVKGLLDSNNDKFGKIGGSYHSGIESAAYIKHTEKVAKEEELLQHQRAGEFVCPYCSMWTVARWIREDSVARGSLNECTLCSREFWT